MKSCPKWMLFCAVIAVGVVLMLPQYGFQFSGFPVLISLLMIGCCVLPMIIMMSKASVGGGSCCGGKHKAFSEEEKKGQVMGTQKPSCH